MATPMCEDGGPLREWAPLSTLLQQIPARIQTGIFTQDVSFTCIAALTEFIAIGTNRGLVYWYNREKQDLQRLRCENAYSKITCVQVISTVDYMVAAGNEHGVITVFQIPKSPPDTLPDSLKPKQKKQVERYSINGLHKNAVTAVEWSKNGMKLFSGDQDGLVVLTEIDFYMHLSKSSQLLNEKYSVVQLSYQQGLLLVSTTLRTILVNRNENGRIIQVGQKERKTLGKLGAVFGYRQNYVQEPVIYASRPGLRLWQADKVGTVLKTLIFKDAVRSGHTEVELLNPAPEGLRKNRGEPSFGIVLPFCDDLIVTYSDDVIYVVNPNTIAISSVVTDLRRVTDVACTKDEIFILEGERNILRIAHYPEDNTFISGETRSTMDPLSSFAEYSKPVATGLLELTSKLKESTVMPAIPFHKINSTNIIQTVDIVPVTDNNAVISAEEAVEIPPIVPLDLNIPLLTHINTILEHKDKRKNMQDEKSNDRRELFRRIGQQEFEDVVFTPKRKQRKSHSKTANENSSHIVSTSIANHSSSNSSANNTNANEAMTTTHSSLLSLSIDDNRVIKSDRDLERIQRDVENKEKLLANILDFDSILSKYMKSSQIDNGDSNIPNRMDTITYINCNVHPNYMMNEEQSANEKKEYAEQSDHTETESGEEDVSYRTELKRLEDLGECRKTLLQSKVDDTTSTGNSFVNFRQVQPVDRHELEVQFNALAKESAATSAVPEEEEEDWVLVKDDIPTFHNVLI
ncbi:PREDICTED: WD repeat-containing protein CG11141 [Dinoponera quadriceps]|uniref:WD repeat-containing protein CG11141 n=1 Tax=Dinoponera quadriceps TaxID=609295 RepID=A0A6P3YD80_DINQU|nr:PREDICTED: WD repeat-containing protein CG11141 [Dinoponera quadriceps]XP_014488984.1 PREDICTED: WD repeat-containing protein CG11141 [Dinoponera quadriceps]XP_014488985.1 PREDICTED: WD repeat-containing protein CG11141 [Dinoponera quadriceps]